MADSLDALLDEVEAKFCREISLSSCTFKAEQDSHRQQRNNDSVHSKPKCSFTASISNPHEVEEIDNNIEAVLQEILDDDYPGSSSHRPVLSKTCAMESCPQTALKKCCPVYLGGSSVASGVGTSVTQRNNMPDCTKLRVKLKRRQGARAYACQCSWHSAFTLSELRHIPKLKWVCGQHTAS
ncbi:cilia- and flagella-associated protein 418 isoform X5 [Pangasianodon hypophthalmus]|uniref:cilia- and flagella-associated protein 418 isoform X5 n=1 Tax=Pangasianodon hypophthalmus TaxID=310915 RepID=UPI00230712C2|nr:cilia- and flagella-associated protein 418 isoform X5 [Pangasianodon hypophthalmus]